MTCANCGRDELWVVHFQTLGAETFAFCRHCEHRRWDTAGAELEVRAVLSSAASIAPAKPKR